jgi:hypothetical protein
MSLDDALAEFNALRHAPMTDGRWTALLERLAEAAFRAAHLLHSAALREHWPELDRFEGAAYRRILVPFYMEEGLCAIGNLYAVSPAAVA